MADTGKIVSLIKSIFGKELADVKTAFEGLGLTVEDGKLCAVVEDENEEEGE